MEEYLPLIIQLISGAVGGNIIGKLISSLSLGTLGNSIAGILGGGIGGSVLSAIGAGGVSGILGQVLGGGVGGGVLMLVVGLIKRLLGK